MDFRGNPYASAVDQLETIPRADQRLDEVLCGYDELIENEKKQQCEPFDFWWFVQGPWLDLIDLCFMGGLLWMIFVTTA